MKRFFLIIGTFIVSQITVAQWTFTSSISKSGNCSGLDALGANIWAAIGDQAPGQLNFATRELCEASRASVSGTYSEGGCTTRVITTPCKGPAGALNGVDILGLSKGNSSYSTNPVNEINDWSNDDMERMLALNSELKSYEPTRVATGDIVFDNSRSGLASGATFVSLDMRPGGSSTIISEDLLPLKERQANVQLVSDYLDRLQGMTIPDLATVEQYTEWIRETFKEVSGYDIAAISKKYDLSEEEKLVLANYREFVSEMSDKIVEGLKRTNDTKVFEMSVLSDDSYGGSDFLSKTNYMRVNLDDVPEDNPMKITSDIIKMFDGNTGFHPELYYNETLNEYTIAFEGSSMNPIQLPSFVADWYDTNYKQGVGDVPDQFKMAAYIAKHIPEGVNVNFTGHSLGGGLASLCGAITGKPTYTFNAEGVNENILKACRVSTGDMSKFSNIKAYYTDNDLLSNTQDVTGRTLAVPAIGERINIGNLQSSVDNYTYTATGAVAGTVAGTIVGSALAPGVGTIPGTILGSAIGSIGGSKAMAHRLKPMVNYFYGEKERKQNDITLAIANERSRSAMRTVESVPIRIE